MKETWKFDVDLTYEHKIERYDSSITTGPFVQSSYSRRTRSVQSGVWAPPNWIRDQLDLFVMSSDGFARWMKWEWIDNSQISVHQWSSLDNRTRMISDLAPA